MSKTKDDLIKFRLQKADEALETAQFAIGRQFWSTGGQRIVLRLLSHSNSAFCKYELDTSTHAGVKTQFVLKFIKDKK